MLLFEEGLGEEAKTKGGKQPNFGFASLFSPAGADGGNQLCLPEAVKPALFIPH